jgi:hypothetical protein
MAVTDEQLRSIAFGVFGLHEYPGQCATYCTVCLPGTERARPAVRAGRTRSAGKATGPSRQSLAGRG